MATSLAPVNGHQSVSVKLKRECMRDARLTVANCQGHGIASFLDQSHSQSLLRRRHATAHDRLALRGQVEEHWLERVRQGIRQRLAIDDDGAATIFRFLFRLCSFAELHAGDFVDGSFNLRPSAFFRLGRQNDLRKDRQSRGKPGRFGQSALTMSISFDKRLQLKPISMAV